MPSERNGSAENNAERRGLKPRTRRAFGCVTWVYMGILVFLAAAFLLLLPFRYVGNGDVYRLLAGLSFLGLLLILPGMALAAALGARTYRTQRRRGTRVGAGIGAMVGWTSFFALAWLTSIIPPPADSGSRTLEADLGSSGFASTAVYYAFAPLALLATGLVLYALFYTRATFEQRRRLIFIGAAVAFVAGLAILAADFGLSEVTGAVVSTIAAALGGWVAGAGYARAGGDEMIPPGAVRRPPK